MVPTPALEFYVLIAPRFGQPISYCSLTEGTLCEGDGSESEGLKTNYIVSLNIHND